MVRFSKHSLAFGQEAHEIEGVPARIFSVAKTAVDCFKIGLDTTLEALRECLKQRKATTADLGAGAKVCRVANHHATVHGGSRLKPGKLCNVAASVRQKLLNIGMRQAEDFGLVLTRYAGAATIPPKPIRCDQFILKGAMLFQIWTDTPTAHAGAQSLRQMEIHRPNTASRFSANSMGWPFPMTVSNRY